jgi:hypothetical protein
MTVSRGSEWRRWEPHIHAPGTVLNNQFGGGDAWTKYLTSLEQSTPKIEAIGVTDYNRSHKPSRTIVACSFVDIEGQRWTTLDFPESTVTARLSFTTKRLPFAVQWQEFCYKVTGECSHQPAHCDPTVR